MSTRNDMHITDRSCFICGKVVEIAHFPLSYTRLETLEKSLLNEISHQIRQSLNDVAVVEEFLCSECAALLDLVDDLESKLLGVKSTLSSLLRQKFMNTLSTSKEIGGESSRVGSCNSVQNGSCYCKSQNNFQSSPGESKNQETCTLLEEESNSENMCKFCSYSSNSEEMLKVHISSEHKEFICSECQLVFVCSGEFNSHVKEKHLGKWACHVCDKVFFSKLLFTNHSRLHLKPLSEKSIGEIDREEEVLDGNLLSKKSGIAVKNHRCTYCNYTTSFKCLFDDHIRSHVSLKLFKCVSCSLLFESKALLDQHKKSHEKLMYVCGVCRRSFMSRESVISHLKEGHKQPYSLEKCNLKQMKRKQECNSHLSVLNVKNHVESIPSVTSYTSSKSNFYAKGVIPSSVSRTEVVKNENLDATLSEEVIDIMHPKISKIENRLSCNFGGGIKSEPLSGNTQSITEDSFLKIGSCSQIHDNPINVNGSSARTLLGSIKSNTTAQGHSNFSFSKEDKVGDRSDAHYVPGCPNVVDPSNDESDFSSADISSEALIIGSGKECSSTKYVGGNRQFVNNKENNFHERGITEANLVEENDNDRNRGLWVSLNSLVDVENLNEPLQGNQGVKEEKDSKLFICGKCSYKAFSAPEIIEHIASHTGEKAQKMFLNEGETNNTSRLHQEANVPTMDGKFSCSYCTWKSDEKLELSNHINEIHLDESALYICRFCKKKCKSKLQLMHHEVNHGRIKVFRCKICRKGFSRENLLNRHRHIAHSISKCCFCTETFQSPEELSEHKSKHEQEDGYQCLECPRIFKTKTGLKFHSAQHTGEYKFRCQYCDQGFMSRVVYQEHMGKHTKEERYVCDVCGRKFCFQSTYWIHRKWHDTPFPYKCDICDRPFRHSSLLKVHKRQHTGERPYHCPHCSRSFSVSGTLKRHLMLHTGNYAFSCGECEKGFTTRNKFALHLSRVHGNDSLLQQGPPKTEFKMVIRDNPKSPKEASKVIESKVNEEDLVVENYEELDSMMVQDGGIVGDGADLLKESSLMLPCSILDDVNGNLETRVVEILVNDETSQAVATVTVEGNSSLVSW